MYLYVIQLKLLNLCRQCVPITVELGQCVLLPVILLLLLPSFSYCESNCDDRLLLRLFIFLSPPQPPPEALGSRLVQLSWSDLFVLRC